MNNLIAQEHKNVIFSKQDWHYDDFGLLRNPIIQETFWRKCATSSVERAIIK